MRIRVWDVPAFWPRDLPRPKIVDIVDVDEGLVQGMIACECGREVKPAAKAKAGRRPESASRAQPERAVMARPQPK